MSRLFPMFLKLDGRSCLVVGAGAIAEPKIRSLLEAGALVRVVAPAISKAVAANTLSARRYESYKRLVNIMRGLAPDYERRR